MKRWVAAIICGAVFSAASALAGIDKHSPDYLRQKYAGTASFTSTEDVPTLFGRISDGASKCYAMTSKDAMMPAGPGVFVFAGGGQERAVVGTKADDDQSGWIRVEVHGIMFGPMIQFDLQRHDGATRVDVYYWHDNTFYRNSITNVQAWAKGDLDFCKLDWGEQRVHDREVAKKAENEAAKKAANNEPAKK